MDRHCIVVTPDGSIGLRNIKEMSQCGGSESFGSGMRNVGQTRISYVLHHSTASSGVPNEKTNVLISNGCACCYQSLAPEKYFVYGNIYITKHCKIGSGETFDGDCDEEDVQFISNILQKRSEYVGSCQEMCEKLTGNVLLFAFHTCIIWVPCLFGASIWYFFL